jgi:hypothetical protein
MKYFIKSETPADQLIIGGFGRHLQNGNHKLIYMKLMIKSNNTMPRINPITKPIVTLFLFICIGVFECFGKYTNYFTTMQEISGVAPTYFILFNLS